VVKLWSGALLALLMNVTVQLAHAEPVDFSLADANGQMRHLSEFRGQWVVVNFWATWCPPCLEEIPELVLFHERHQSTNAVVLGVNYETVPSAQMRAFIETHQMTYPILLNVEAKPPHPRLTIDGLPMTYIISPQGELVARHTGAITADELEAFIERKTRAAATNKQTQAQPEKPQ